MEFEKADWNELSQEQRREALQFVPDVMDKTLGSAFVSCVTDAEQKNAEFDLKVIFDQGQSSQG